MPHTEKGLEGSMSDPRQFIENNFLVLPRTAQAAASERPEHPAPQENTVGVKTLPRHGIRMFLSRVFYRSENSYTNSNMEED